MEVTFLSDPVTAHAMQPALNRAGAPPGERDMPFCPSHCLERRLTLPRRHRPAHMSFDTARAAIDHYRTLYLSIYDQVSEANKAMLLRDHEPYIGFHGGEPTLNFEVVRRTAGYFKQLDWGRPEIHGGLATMSMNTNLSRMDNEVIDFLEIEPAQRRFLRGFFPQTVLNFFRAHDVLLKRPSGGAEPGRMARRKNYLILTCN